MKKKNVSNKVAKRVIAISTISQRENVSYVFNNDMSVNCKFHSFKDKDYTATINKKLSNELYDLRLDRKAFYTKINDNKILSLLNCDAQAKKQDICKNTQYDSRKKLQQMYIQIALSKASQKAKSKKQVKLSKSSKLAVSK